MREGNEEGEEAWIAGGGGGLRNAPPSGLRQSEISTWGPNKRRSVCVGEGRHSREEGQGAVFVLGQS